MFVQIFSRAAAVARHRAGPLAEERNAYLTHIAQEGMSRKTLREIANYLLVIVDHLHLSARSGETINREEISQKATLWANRKPKPSEEDECCYSQKAFFRHATRWLQFLGRLEQRPVPISPHAELISAFAVYMRDERGLSPQTIRGRCYFVQRFLDQLSVTADAFREIAITQIDGALLAMVTRDAYKRVSVQTWASHLRAFFRYAETRGWCRNGLAAAIQGPRVYSQDSLPAGPSWDDVRKLIANTAGDRPVNIRNRAILMLLAIYGLRAGEVAHLKLEDFDWQRELLCVTCSKTRKTRTYPLTRPVGDAVLRYLTEIRPRSVHREVFLRLQAPIRPLRVLWSIVGPRLRSLGVSTAHHGPHALRHACAAHLLAQGLSLKEIGDHLGHRDPDATRIYAKVDLAGLRQVADFDLGGLQ